ncbi:MAG: YtxH domain-containing protein [bacterium]
MSRNTCIAKGLLIGFLSGAVVGTSVALLYAPKSGKKLRRDINHKAHDLKEDTNEFINSAKEKALSILNEGINKAESMVSDAKFKAEELIKEAYQS